MKVIIPVAGMGTRLRPHTHTVPKVLLKVAGKTIIEHIVDELLTLDYEFSEVIFIVGYLGDQIEEYISEKYKGKINLKFIYQTQRSGVGEAIYLTKEYVNDEPVFIIFGDTIFKADFKNIIKSNANYIGVKEVEDPRRFGIVFVDKEMNATKFIEKPDKPESNLAIVGIYLIQKSKMLFDKIEYIIKNDIRTKGEYQLTDALELMLQDKENFKTFIIDKWLDCGKPETMLSTNQELLDLENHSPKYKDAIIIPPNYISDSAKIENAVIGPYVSVGDNVVIKNSVIKNSIVNDDAVVNKLLLDGSLVGRSAIIKGAFRHLNIGDSSEVKLG